MKSTTSIASLCALAALVLVPAATAGDAVRADPEVHGARADPANASDEDRVPPAKAVTPEEERAQIEQSVAPEKPAPQERIERPERFRRG